MASCNPVVNVLFGTVTGNAEEIARRVHTLLPNKGVQQGLLRSLKDYADVPVFSNPSNRVNVYNIIVVSTTGDGDPPETIRPFMRLIRSKDKSLLVGLKFAVLGLGDTNYENFCRTGKRIDTALVKLGAERFMKRGDADDGVGLELVVEPWLSTLWTFFETLTQSGESALTSQVRAAHGPVGNGCKETVQDIIKRVTAEQFGFDETQIPPIPVPKLRVEQIKTATEHESFPSLHPSYSPLIVRTAELKHAQLLTATDFEKEVWHVELVFQSNAQFAPSGYHPGAAFGIFVENDCDETLRFIRATGSDPQQILRLRDQNDAICAVASTERFVRERLDIRAIPSKTLLRVLSEHTEDEIQRRNLLHLSSRKGRFEYTERISKQNMTILGLLEKVAPTCKAPIDIYIDLLPSIPLRWYSLTSSSSLDGDNVIHFAFSVIEKGLATNALARRCRALLSGEPAEPVVLIPRESDSNSHFCPPPTLDTSYIMIGPGTGVAPFRGFLRERKYLLENTSSGNATLGKTMLFFGCRHKEKDFLYRNDLEDLADGSVLSVLDVAFSRDTDKKVYVQDRLLERQSEVAEIIKGGGSVYVCGDGGNMAKDVHLALTSIVSANLCDNDEDAGKAMITRLSADHRYVRDIWFYG